VVRIKIDNPPLCFSPPSRQRGFEKEVIEMAWNFDGQVARPARELRQMRQIADASLSKRLAWEEDLQTLPLIEAGIAIVQKYIPDFELPAEGEARDWKKALNQVAEINTPQFDEDAIGILPRFREWLEVATLSQ